MVRDYGSKPLLIGDEIDKSLTFVISESTRSPVVEFSISLSIH